MLRREPSVVAETLLTASHAQIERLAERVAARMRNRLGVPAVSIMPGSLEAAPPTWVPSVDENDQATRLLLAARIDHTLLRADATNADLWRLCDEARRHGFATVCVNGANVASCVELLRNSRAGVCAVAGFPLGAATSAAKAFEARAAAAAGACEVDVVLNLGALREGDYERVRDELVEVVRAARPARVKVIIEAGLLEDEEKIAACMLARIAGAHFVKTSTGFGPGATPRDVALMRWAVGAAFGVKASGGIRSRREAIELLRAGADRLGTSAGVAIVAGDEQPRAPQ